MAYHLRFHPDGGWPSDTWHHSWPSHSQKVWYCVSKGIWFQPKGGGRHRQAPSAAFKCFRQSGSKGIIGVRTCRRIFFGWLASIHHSIGTLTRCIDTWLCNGFSSMVSAWLGICNFSCYTDMNVSNGFQPTFKCFRQSGSEWNHWCPNMPPYFFFGWLVWLASIHHSIGTLTRCIDTWLCNGFASMVSAWLGMCNVSSYTYMNVSNGCHSAKTTGQLPVTNGFTMIADDGMTLSSRL